MNTRLSDDEIETGRIWLRHIKAIRTKAESRHARHDHRNGGDRCPVCSDPGDYRRCGLDDCEICGHPQTQPIGAQT